MLKALVIVIVAGAGIGLMLPTGAQPPGEQARSTAAPGEPVRLERSGDGHFYVHGEVDGQLARFLVDTGATSVALTMRDAERLGIKFSQDQFTIVGTGASGPVRGQEVMLRKVVVEGREVTQVRGVVLEGLEISLLGQAFLSRIGSIEMSGDYMVLR